jgi:hypothetical protein
VAIVLREMTRREALIEGRLLGAAARCRRADRRFEVTNLTSRMSNNGGQGGLILVSHGTCADPRVCESLSSAPIERMTPALEGSAHPVFELRSSQSIMERKSADWPSPKATSLSKISAELVPLARSSL